MTKTPGSDDVDMIEFLGAAMDVRRIIAHLLEPVARNHGLSGTHPQHRRSRHAGLNRPSLVDYLGVLPSTISSDVDKLAGLGLLRRTVGNRSPRHHPGGDARRRRPAAGSRDLRALRLQRWPPCPPTRLRVHHHSPQDRRRTAPRRPTRRTVQSVGVARVRSQFSA